MDRPWYMEPAKLVERRVDRRRRRLGRELRVPRRILEAQTVVQVVGLNAVWLALNREPGNFLRGPFRQVEREQRLRITAIGDNRQIARLADHKRHRRLQSRSMR